VRDTALLLCGHRRLSLIFLFKANRHHQPTGTPDHPVKEQT